MGSKKSAQKHPQSGKVKKETKKEPTPRPEPPRTRNQDVTRQQRILNVFKDTFNEVISSDGFNATLQEVKQALFNREFDKAFGREEYLEVYAARWSPTRALCYEAVLERIRPHIDMILRPDPAEEDGGGDETQQSPSSGKVVSIGGGAAEIVAFGAFLSRLAIGDGEDSGLYGNIHLVDSGPWAHVVERLRVGLTTPPQLSKYAGAAARAANAALIDESRLSATFTQDDVLSLDKAGLASLVGKAPALVTLMFTLNELFTSGGIGKTTSFLIDMSTALATGSLILVVDSPGSYSETVVGKQARKYPMQWVLDTIMGSTEKIPNFGRAWRKLESADSVWFRLAGTLDYPIPLEDMRYQMHLYRLDPEDDSDTAPKRLMT